MKTDSKTVEKKKKYKYVLIHMNCYPYIPKTHPYALVSKNRNIYSMSTHLEVNDSDSDLIYRGVLMQALY